MIHLSLNCNGNGAVTFLFSRSLMTLGQVDVLSEDRIIGSDECCIIQRGGIPKDLFMTSLMETSCKPGVLESFSGFVSWVDQMKAVTESLSLDKGCCEDPVSTLNIKVITNINQCIQSIILMKKSALLLLYMVFRNSTVGGGFSLFNT